METTSREHFIDVLKSCKQSSKEAVENLDSFSPFKKYMHVQRPVEIELERCIIAASHSAEPQLILVCGGVGDGKSHILSYLLDKYDFLKDSNTFYFHNDATESFSPRKTSIETLATVLKPFSDEGLLHSGSKKIVLAINLGTLNNFIESEYGDAFSRLRDFVRKKRILESVLDEEDTADDHIFKFVNFSDYHLYQLTEHGPKSDYIKGIFRKISQKTDDNPFYQAYLNDYEDDREIALRNPIIQNYELFQHEDVQDKIIELLIQAMIKEKLIISTRGLLDFIYNILVPASMENMSYPQIKDFVRELDFRNYTSSLLPFQLFEKKDASLIHQAIYHINPTRIRTEELDYFLIEFKSRKDGAYLFSRYLEINRLPYFAKSFLQNSPWRNPEGKDQLIYRKSLVKLFVYLYYLIPKTEHSTFEDSTYQLFMKYLYYWNKREWSKLAKLYRDDIREAIYNWNGEGNGDLIYVQIGQPQTQYYALQKLEIEPHINRTSSLSDVELHKFLTMMNVQFRNKNSNSSIASIDIDYTLYAFLVRINRGYRPNKKDKFQFIKFVEFIETLSEFGNSKEEIIFESKQSKNKTRYRLKYDELFDQYTFMEM